MPYVKGLFQSLEDVLLEWKDLVLQGTGSNRGQWRSAVGSVRVSLSRCMWVASGSGGDEVRYFFTDEHAQGGVSPSAHRVAYSL